MCQLIAVHERDRRADESGPLATDEARAHRHVDLIHEVGGEHRCIERRSTLELGEVAVDLFECAGQVDGATARALRRYFDSADQFPRDVMELQAFLDDPVPGQAVTAWPGAGSKVPLWLLGSSLFSAELADWCDDDAFWPELSPALFSEWFDVEIHSVLTDLVDQPLEREAFIPLDLDHN